MALHSTKLQGLCVHLYRLYAHLSIHFQSIGPKLYEALYGSITYILIGLNCNTRNSLRTSGVVFAKKKKERKDPSF